MKKILLIMIAILMTTQSVHAACSLTSTIYTSCKPGYYLSANDCVRCPIVGTHESGTTVYGTTADNNTGGITSCYAPTGPYRNEEGVFKLNGTCYYQ